ncbi:hypothetical protein BACPEC_00412 [[Bacteroides] pectinophilus ATCC 43243]|uniref:Uncharacterized protein n=1 Tax=[Bacteroides] pectinophilus ATCC 43243 TaxID=483218 RepID=B7AP08_9FIRM|nr:hypothetical protein BACPEC_00412 [[Bacteroides] pectinophilus ATCC 43243]
MGFISLLTCDSYIRIPPSFYFVNNFSKLFLLFSFFFFIHHILCFLMLYTQFMIFFNKAFLQ